MAQMENYTRDDAGGEPEDFELMRRVRDGDRDAFAVLVRRHQQALVNFFHRLGAYNDAEDLAQTTFLKVFEYRFRYRETAKFTTFLYTLGRHAWIDGYRRSRRRDAYAEEQRETGEVSDMDSASRARARLDAAAALGHLPEKLRSVVVMGICQDLGYDEIGAILGIPVGTVKSRMFNALRKMKEFFDGKPPAT